MIHVYFNYQHYQIITHHDPDCAQRTFAQMPHQRLLRVNAATVSQTITALAANEHPFSTALGQQTLWLQIDFGDHDFERALQRYALRLLARHYPRFYHISVTSHC